MIEVEPLLGEPDIEIGKQASQLSARDFEDDASLLITPLASNYENKVVSDSVFVSQKKLDNSENSSKYEFYSYKGEKYRDTISRWLNKAGYTTVVFFLDDRSTRALNRQVDETNVEYSYLNPALDGALRSAILLDQEKVIVELKKLEKNLQTGIEPTDFVRPTKLQEIYDKEEAPIKIRIDLNEKKKEAVITSSKMPVVVFNAQPGSLKKNYLELAKFYDWNASPDFYLATDYQVSFGFPIATEVGNVSRALEELLTPYLNLRAVTVPTTREIYILQDKE